MFSRLGDGGAAFRLQPGEHHECHSLSASDHNQIDRGAKMVRDRTGCQGAEELSGPGCQIDKSYADDGVLRANDVIGVTDPARLMQRP